MEVVLLLDVVDYSVVFCHMDSWFQENIQKELDPIGVLERKQRRLKRRVYHNKGPNYLLHVDGYDKLKRFGFAIHGCVCGFSRRVLWLRVGRSNNDPKVIASYFLDFEN